MRSVRVLAALALTVAATITATTVNAAPGDGTITVTLVDEHGDPMPGSISISSSSGFIDASQAASTGTFTVPPGSYGVVAITPWGGIQCVGFDPCDYFALSMGTATPNGDFVVTAGQVTSATISGTKPVALSGSGRVGAPLSLDFSDGMERMMEYLGGVGGTGLAPTVTWLRDGEPIDEATDDDTYRPDGADVGKMLSARVAYTGVALAQFQMISGALVTPRTTNAITIAKVPTKAFAILSNPVVKAGHQGRVRIEVTAKNLIVTGKAMVTVGNWSQTRALRNGGARVMLPKLGPGKHVVEVRYLGTSVYQAATAKPKTVTVTK